MCGICTRRGACALKVMFGVVEEVGLEARIHIAVYVEEQNCVLLDKHGEVNVHSVDYLTDASRELCVQFVKLYLAHVLGVVNE